MKGTSRVGVLSVLQCRLSSGGKNEHSHENEKVKSPLD